MRDKDPKRYLGRGVLHAVKNVEASIAPALKGMDPTKQADIDKKMIDLDGTPTKSKLGKTSTHCLLLVLLRQLTTRETFGL